MELMIAIVRTYDVRVCVCVWVLKCVRMPYGVWIMCKRLYDSQCECVDEMRKITRSNEINV